MSFNFNRELPKTVTYPTFIIAGSFLNTFANFLGGGSITTPDILIPAVAAGAGVVTNTLRKWLKKREDNYWLQNTDYNNISGSRASPLGSFITSPTDDT